VPKLGLWALFAALAVLGPTGHARTETYPNRPITLIVPFPPGGSTDIVARIVADKLAGALRQPIVVDNRGGAGGTVGSRAAAKSAPDGYTLLLSYTGTLAVGPSLYANVGYDPRKDFDPVGRIGTAPSMLLAHPSFPARSVSELIAYAKVNPGKVDYGSAGVGTVGHVAGEYLATLETKWSQVVKASGAKGE
jgi:tripartite-type tricarboxylate transporter receptor subunit TctC